MYFFIEYAYMRRYLCCGLYSELIMACVLIFTFFRYWKMDKHLENLKKMSEEVEGKSYQLDGCFGGIKVTKDQCHLKDFITKTISQVRMLGKNIDNELSQLKKVVAEDSTTQRQQMTIIKKENFTLKRKIDQTGRGGRGQYLVFFII